MDVPCVEASDGAGNLLILDCFSSRGQFSLSGYFDALAGQEGGQVDVGRMEELSTELAELGDSVKRAFAGNRHLRDA